MRVCIDKETGCILESQSGGEGAHIEDGADRAAYCDTGLNALLQSALESGFTPDQVTVCFMDDDEAKRIIDAQIETERSAAKTATPPSLVDQVLADPEQVAKLKKALGLA